MKAAFWIFALLSLVASTRPSGMPHTPRAEKLLALLEAKEDIPPHPARPSVHMKGPVGGNGWSGVLLHNVVELAPEASHELAAFELDEGLVAVRFNEHMDADDFIFAHGTTLYRSRRLLLDGDTTVFELQADASVALLADFSTRSDEHTISTSIPLNWDEANAKPETISGLSPLALGAIVNATVALGVSNEFITPSAIFFEGKLSALVEYGVLGKIISTSLSTPDKSICMDVLGYGITIGSTLYGAGVQLCIAIGGEATFDMDMRQDILRQVAVDVTCTANWHSGEEFSPSLNYNTLTMNQKPFSLWDTLDSDYVTFDVASEVYVKVGFKPYVNLGVSWDGFGGVKLAINHDITIDREYCVSPSLQQDLSFDASLFFESSKVSLFFLSIPSVAYERNLYTQSMLSSCVFDAEETAELDYTRTSTDSPFSLILSDFYASGDELAGTFIGEFRITASNGDSAVSLTLPEVTEDDNTVMFNNQFFIPDIDESWHIVISLLEKDLFFDDYIVLFSGSGADLLSECPSGEFQAYLDGYTNSYMFGFSFVQSFQSLPNTNNDISQYITDGELSGSFMTTFPIEVDWFSTDTMYSTPIFLRSSGSAFLSEGTFKPAVDLDGSQTTVGSVCAISEHDQPWSVTFEKFSSDEACDQVQVSIIAEFDNKNSTVFFVNSELDYSKTTGDSSDMTYDMATITWANLAYYKHTLKVLVDIDDDPLEFDFSSTTSDYLDQTSTLLLTYFRTIDSGQFNVTLRLEPADDFWFLYTNEDMTFDDVTSVVHSPFLYLNDNVTTMLDFASHPYIAGKPDGFTMTSRSSYKYVIFEFLYAQDAQNVDCLNAVYQGVFGEFLLVILEKDTNSFILRGRDQITVYAAVYHYGFTKSASLRRESTTFSYTDTLLSDLDMAGVEGSATVWFDRFVLNAGDNPLVVMATTSTYSSQTGVNDFTSYMFPSDTTTASFGPTKHGHFQVNTTNSNIKGWTLNGDVSTVFDGVVYELTHVFYTSGDPVSISAVCDTSVDFDGGLIIPEYCIFEHSSERGILVLDSPAFLSTAEDTYVRDKVGSSFSAGWTDTAITAYNEPLDNLVPGSHQLTVTMYDADYNQLTLYVSTEDENGIQVPLRDIAVDEECLESALGITDSLLSYDYNYQSDGTILLSSDIDVVWNNREFCIFPENTGIDWKDELKTINISIVDVQPETFRRFFVEFLDYEPHTIIPAGTAFTATFTTDEEELAGDFYLCVNEDDCEKAEVRVDGSTFQFETTRDVTLQAHETLTLFLQYREERIVLNLEMSVLEACYYGDIFETYCYLGDVFGTEELRDLFVLYDVGDVDFEYWIEVAVDGEPVEPVMGDRFCIIYPTFGLETGAPADQFTVSATVLEEWGSRQTYDIDMRVRDAVVDFTPPAESISFKFLPDVKELYIEFEVLMSIEGDAPEEIGWVLTYVRSLEDPDNWFIWPQEAEGNIIYTELMISENLNEYLDHDDIDIDATWMFEEMFSITVGVAGYSQEIVTVTPLPISVKEYEAQTVFLADEDETFEFEFDLVVYNWEASWETAARVYRCEGDECVEVVSHDDPQTPFRVTDDLGLDTWYETRTFEYKVTLARPEYDCDTNVCSQNFTITSVELAFARVAIALDDAQEFYVGECPQVQFSTETNVNDLSIVSCELTDMRNRTAVEIELDDTFSVELANITSFEPFNVSISCNVGEPYNFFRYYEIADIACYPETIRYEDTCYQFAVSASYSVSLEEEDEDIFIAGSVTPVFDGPYDSYPLIAELMHDAVSVTCIQTSVARSDETLSFRIAWDADSSEPADYEWTLLLMVEANGRTAMWTSDEITFEAIETESGFPLYIIIIIVGVLVVAGGVLAAIFFIKKRSKKPKIDMDQPLKAERSNSANQGEMFQTALYDF